MLRMRRFGKDRCGYDARNTGLRHNRSLPRCRTGIDGPAQNPPAAQERGPPVCLTSMTIRSFPVSLRWMKQRASQPQNQSPCPRTSARSVLTGRRPHDVPTPPRRVAREGGASRNREAVPPLDGISRLHNIPRSFQFHRHAPRRRGYINSLLSPYQRHDETDKANNHKRHDVLHEIRHVRLLSFTKKTANTEIEKVPQHHRPNRCPKIMHNSFLSFCCTMENFLSLTCFSRARRPRGPCRVGSRPCRRSSWHTVAASHHPRS